MGEEDEYEVKAQDEKTKEIEGLIDKNIQEEKPPSTQKEPDKRPPPKTSVRKAFPIPQIPANKIFQTITDREKMRQTLHDETLEPHVHLAILLFIVFILAIIIAILGSILGI